MIEDLSDLIRGFEGNFWVGFSVFIRIGAMMAVLPAFGENSVPTRLRIAGSIAFSLLVAPAIDHGGFLQPATPLAYLKLFLPEVIVGLLFGLGLRFFVLALQIAGAIGAQSTSLSQIFGGTAGVESQAAMGKVLVVAGLALAALLGLHVKIFSYILQSYQLVPFGVLISSDIVAKIGVSEVSRAFALGFTLAAPFVVASFVYNITLGVINRAMPQLMVSFVGAPAITAGGLILMAMALPLLLSIWVDAFQGFLLDPFGQSR